MADEVKVITVGEMIDFLQDKPRDLLLVTMPTGYTFSLMERPAEPKAEEPANETDKTTEIEVSEEKA